MGSRGWHALVLEVDAGDVDEAAGGAAPGCLGVEERQVSAGRSELRFFFEDAAQARQARDAAVGFGPGRIEAVPDGRWVERYLATLEPFPLGGRFAVLPRGGEPNTVAGDRIAIRLVPGRAFGTGEHPTTRLCAEALERGVRDGTRWLDLGCGSGLLSVVALHCGAAEVTAVDHDPEALEVAAEVLAANDGSDRVRRVSGSLVEAGDGPWDGIVCNISGPFLIQAAAALAARLRPGGLLIGSGLLAHEASDVKRCLVAGGLRPGDVRREGEWALLEGWR